MRRDGGNLDRTRITTELSAKDDEETHERAQYNRGEAGS
jgi:hypothetical protein